MKTIVMLLRKEVMMVMLKIWWKGEHSEVCGTPWMPWRVRDVAARQIRGAV